MMTIVTDQTVREYQTLVVFQNNNLDVHKREAAWMDMLGDNCWFRNIRALRCKEIHPSAHEHITLIVLTYNVSDLDRDFLRNTFKLAEYLEAYEDPDQVDLSAECS